MKNLYREIAMADEVPENINRFNRITLTVLAILYENFPNPADLATSEIGIQAAGDVIEGKEDGELAFVWIGDARSTIIWLKEEGFLKVRMGEVEGSFLHTVLTQKGLGTLSQVPSSIKENPEKVPLGKLAKSTLASGAKELVSEVAKAVIGVAIKAASSA